jgi:hypothetical protein
VKLINIFCGQNVELLMLKRVVGSAMRAPYWPTAVLSATEGKAARHFCALEAKC